MMKYASLARTTFAFLLVLWLICLVLSCRCTIDNRVTRVAWLNRSTILYAGNDKWCLDPRVVLLSNTQTQYSIEIQNVDVYDEGPYTCSVQTDNHPKTSRVHLIVQGGWGLAGRPEWVAGNINITDFFSTILIQARLAVLPSKSSLVVILKLDTERFINLLFELNQFFSYSSIMFCTKLLSNYCFPWLFLLLAFLKCFIQLQVCFILRQEF